MNRSKKIIELKNVSKSFDGQKVLDNINLYICDNEFLTLLGPSGCGKTTTLRIIGGFEFADEGDVIFLGDRINDVPPHKRNVNTVFQRYALFPHLNVFENVAFPLREKKVPKAEINERVTEMLKLVALAGFEKRSVNSLSGGQQQRVAIARALVSKPSVLLLDEPLAALDLKLRKDMQQELKKIQKATGITFVFVTHDQEEALSMSDTVVVMSEGRIQQIGTPVDIYNEPKNAFVADFIGESNILDGIMLRDRKVSFAGHIFDCVDSGFELKEPVDVVVRPEDVDIVPEEKGMLKGVVTSVTFLGVHYEIIVDIDGFKWMIQTTDFVDVDEHIGLYIEPDAIHIMHKSEYSGMFGDYSSFSMELDEIGELEEENLEELGEAAAPESEADT
ncbi:MAG: ABC transporter ATP-binding protein [Oscillospiraceae bacterium]|jgi:spermidine/putrescine transport system ATP-binding protein|nr:ABC transporter ATP-binding protein [Oscillospiraceae bacterium]